MLTNEEIELEIKTAFAPLECGTEIWDYNQKIRFRVFVSSGSGIISMPELMLDSIRDELTLRGILDELRSKVMAKGYELNP